MTEYWEGHRVIRGPSRIDLGIDVPVAVAGDRHTYYFSVSLLLGPPGEFEVCFAGDALAEGLFREVTSAISRAVDDLDLAAVLVNPLEYSAKILALHTAERWLLHELSDDGPRFEPQFLEKSRIATYPAEALGWLDGGLAVARSFLDRS